MEADSAVVRRQGNRREILLEAAARQFLRHGFAAASMRDIAADAGMQAGSIYYHFPSKDELLVAVHEQGLRHIKQSVTRALAGETDPWRRIEAACIAHLEVLLEGGEFYQVVMREIPREADPLRAKLVRWRDDYEAIFTGLIDDLALPGRVDRHSLRLMLLGAINWSHSWYRPGADSPGLIASKFVSFLRHALDPDVARESSR